MKAAYSILGVLRCVHAEWTDYVRLFLGGRFERVTGNNGGSWTLSGDVLTLEWDRLGAEEYLNVGGEFILISIRLPAMTCAGAQTAELSRIIRNTVASHPDRTAWLGRQRSGPTLGIIIPYRDREEHLATLIPHLVSFFARDLRNSHIRPLIVVSEQTDAQAFNRGWCCNAGFLAAADDCDYVCFHDVDYLPMWADYGYASFPTRMIWYGSEARPIRTSHDNPYRLPASRKMLRSVVLMDKTLFLAVNGFSNQYRGWGFEDCDLAARLEVLGVPTTSRLDGTFLALDHDHAGLTQDGRKNDVWLRNEMLYRRLKREYQERGIFPEGLSTLPLEEVSVRFETWRVDDADEVLTICRLEVGQPD